MSAFERELTSCMPSLRAFAHSLTGKAPQADDLVQQTMLKAWNKQSSFQLGTNIKAWLFTIMKNEFYSQMRVRGREVDDPDDIFTNSMATPASQHSHMDLLDLKAAMVLLPQEQREAIILVGISGHSYEEAAEKARCAVGTMKSRVSRARVALLEMLEQKPALKQRKHVWAGGLRNLKRKLREQKQPKEAKTIVFRRKYNASPARHVAQVAALPKIRAEHLLFCGMEFAPLERMRLSAGIEAQIYTIVQ